MCLQGFGEQDMNKDAVILVVDGRIDSAQAIAADFGKKGCKVIAAESAEQAIELLDQKRFDLVIAAHQPSASPGTMELLTSVRRFNPPVPVIVVSATPDIEACKECLRRGAMDFVVEPVNPVKLVSLAEQAVPLPAGKSAMADFLFAGIVSRSPLVQAVFRVLRRVSKTDLSILIEGESGTGKEMTAQAIHHNSPRRDKPFFPINCAGLSESLLESELFGHVKGSFTGAVSDRKGLFQLADKGTLFLDEIGDMPLSMQAKLLRVLEDGLVMPVGGTAAIKVDVRIISATNQDLAKLVEEKKFRQDLYFRVKGVSVTLPALRNRPQDIPELFGYFLKEACTETSADIHLITEPAMRALMAYSWPGNIRQLRNAVRMMVVMCESDTIDLRDLPPEISLTKQLGAPGQAGILPADDLAARPLEEVEREHIRRVLDMTGHNRTEAAKILQIGERTLYRKIKEYNL